MHGAVDPAYASLEEEDRWPEYVKWITQRLIAMDRVLRPILKSLP